MPFFESDRLPAARVSVHALKRAPKQPPTYELRVDVPSDLVQADFRSALSENQVITNGLRRVLAETVGLHPHDEQHPIWAAYHHWLNFSWNEYLPSFPHSFEHSQLLWQKARQSAWKKLDRSLKSMDLPSDRIQQATRLLASIQRASDHGHVLRRLQSGLGFIHSEDSPAFATALKAHLDQWLAPLQRRTTGHRETHRDQQLQRIKRWAMRTIHRKLSNLPKTPEAIELLRHLDLHSNAAARLARQAEAEIIRERERDERESGGFSSHLVAAPSSGFYYRFFYRFSESPLPAQEMAERLTKHLLHYGFYVRSDVASQSPAE